MLISAHALEGEGVNAIPEALAEFLAQEPGLEIGSGIVQTNAVGHTGASGFERLALFVTFNINPLISIHF